ncbi:protein of unknown function [Ralstonia solanacearum CMR15]|nr:protein of unknown function [Ralstonia solanacearum CMR15]
MLVGPPVAQAIVADHVGTANNILVEK